MENRKLILSRIKTPDGTILTSRHRHDYVTHTDANGLMYMLDGGNDYQRVNIHPGAPFEDLSIYSDAPFEVIREHYSRGGRGKDGKQPLKWVALKDMSDDWLEAALIYNLERNMGNSFANIMYVAEQDYRKHHNIKVVEKAYEIIRFSDGFNIYSKMPSGLFTVNTAHTYDEEYILKKCHYKIHSIKRLSDGEVFTVGDKVCWDWFESKSKYFTVVSFRLSYDMSEVVLDLENNTAIRVVFEGLFNDEEFNFRHYKSPLFTTEDGVEVFEGDTYWHIDRDFQKWKSTAHKDFTPRIIFSTKELAEEYIKMNKPEFSRNQVTKMLEELKNK